MSDDKVMEQETAKEEIKKETIKAKVKAKEPKPPKAKKKETRLTLPRFLRLAKGGMWRDTEGEYASGAVVYSLDRIMVGREPKFQKDKRGEYVKDNEGKIIQIDTGEEPPTDQYNNENIQNYGFIEEKMPWYLDLKTIPTEKLGRIIIAVKSGVLVRADPKNPPVSKEPTQKSEWKMKKDGELIFDGANKEMYKKLQNLNFQRLKQFVVECPKTEAGRDNLLDLLDYEKRGFNALSRPRLEVLDMIRAKLQEYGNGMSGLRRNDITNQVKDEN